MLIAIPAAKIKIKQNASRAFKEMVGFSRTHNLEYYAIIKAMNYILQYQVRMLEVL